MKVIISWKSLKVIEISECHRKVKKSEKSEKFIGKLKDHNIRKSIKHRQKKTHVNTTLVKFCPNVAAFSCPRVVISNLHGLLVNQA